MTDRSGAATRPTFERTEDGLAVVDPVERHRYVLSTGPTRPTATDPSCFRFPVESAVSVRTDKITLPSVVSVHVRDKSGVVVARAEHHAEEQLPAGEYIVEVSAPVKLYFRVESALQITADAEGMAIEFEGEREVLIGARSHHERPATTVQTPADPEAMMEAISTFGSALKTTTPERSYPTLRGHPPTVELGDSLDLAGLEPPDTGVTIEVPADYESIYVAAPLAYYLGATVEPGAEPLLRTDRGFEQSLAGSQGFEQTVARTLKQTFFLDCLTRTEGLYPVDLHERRVLEGELGLDFPTLYEQSLATQLETYLSIPYRTIAEHLPTWKLTANVAATPASSEHLPFVVADLAIVRAVNPASSPEAMAADEKTADGRSGFVDGPAAIDIEEPFVRPEPAESLEQTWIGEGTPLGASKASLAAYRNRLERTPAEGDIEITVVCNDAAMDDERAVGASYGERADLPFDVTVAHDLTTNELADVLATRTDFLHYIGHVDSEGFACADGRLDARRLDSVGVDAFLLNACQSYQQGIALIEAGAIGGIVTLTDILNSEGIKMGRALARLLNAGFPLGSALEIARSESIMGDEYLVVGDGEIAIAQAAHLQPNLCEIERGDNSFRATYKTFLTSWDGIGTVVRPEIGDNTDHYISSGDVESFDVTEEELLEFLSLEDIPVIVREKLNWSRSVDSESV
ncbi:hypothetical protein C448_14789 [Halococcus morrhuae DSM 1307]|uniref:CHAT domain-containing protein n=1 Tax=Halococcus morrhuae DSM 1307 TaxID=931277 RepID=M0M4M7_HALMO|nr:hypothetical protein [Halococcus morrhuae]EMA39335.1 hypothetical protein C448_14789 [Halococcus morrhuae DSM 1307]